MAIHSMSALGFGSTSNSCFDLPWPNVTVALPSPGPSSREVYCVTTGPYPTLTARIFMLTIRPSDSNIWRESRLVAGRPYGETSDLRLQEERPNGIPEV